MKSHGRLEIYAKNECSGEKRKVDAECRVFKSSWTEDFFVIEHNSSVLCLVCQQKVTVFKEYNIKRRIILQNMQNDLAAIQVRLEGNSLKK